MSNTGLTNEPMWSPDGRYIAMVLHTEHACQAGGCFGVCERWYAPSKARNISTGRTPVRAYEKSNTSPQGLWCERDVFWTR